MPQPAKLFIILLWLAFAFAVAGCRRDEAADPATPSTPVDGRDKFVGTYQVFDTLGVYLYEMQVSKFGTGGRDSLLLTNYADTFDLKVLHESYWNQDFLQIGAFFPAIDRAGHSWALFGAPGLDGSNVLVNDTIPLKFTMDNIAFYWTEGMPYFSCVCNQIAVKQ
jgi:hypothetical protein